MSGAASSVESPCVSECELDREGVCKGCYRLSSEIATWLTMSDNQRQTVVSQAQARKLAALSRSN